jgi:hypothetical protein
VTPRINLGSPPLRGTRPSTCRSEPPVSFASRP